MKFMPKAALAAALISCTVASSLGTGVAFAHTVTTKTLSGSASWYGAKFHGNLTANGEHFNMNAMTAAHRTLPFDTEIRVTNQNNGKSVVVRINDRGPYAGHRILDLSKGAAQKIGLISSGVAPVTIQVLA